MTAFQRQKGFSTVPLLALVGLAFLAIFYYSKSTDQKIEKIKKESKLTPGGSGPAMLDAARNHYLKKCTGPADDKNFFHTCLQTPPRDCTEVVNTIITRAQEIFGKPYTWRGVSQTVTKFADAMELAAFEKILPAKRELARCQRNP